MNLKALRTAWPVLCIAIIAQLFLSCQHKELCYHHPHTKVVSLEFDWRDAPQASPEGMCVFFYPLDGEDAPARRFDFSGKKGGEIDIQEGRYRVLCYNNDTEALLLRGAGSFDTHEGYTREGSIFESISGSRIAQAPRAKDAEDERVVICPDMMWGCTALDVEITEEGVSYLCFPESQKDDWAGLPPVVDEQVITLYPHELICTYTYEVRNVKNLKYVTKMCGSISSMAPSLFFGSEALGAECVTLPFEAASDGQSRITGSFLTFGHNEANTRHHRMVFYVWFTDGSKYYYTFDVTDQVHNAPDKRHVHIIIDGLDFPQPIANGNGLQPSVDDWFEVDETIIM